MLSVSIPFMFERHLLVLTTVLLITHCSAPEMLVTVF
jgi:hypothetical protein